MSETETGWFPFAPDNSNDTGVIGMQDWLEKPAGKRGPVLAVGDHFELGDGSPIKFWGINLGNRCNCPEHALSEFWAARWAKYGINCVRMHKFLNPQWEGIGNAENSAEFDEDSIDRLDYLVFRLKSSGIYPHPAEDFHFYKWEMNAGQYLEQMFAHIVIFWYNRKVNHRKRWCHDTFS